MSKTTGIKFINFNQLRSFHAVASTLSITKAAELLFIGQPTVTTQLKNLEQRFNVLLLNRTSQQLTLTPEGKSLYEITSQIFSLEEKAVKLLSAQDSEVRSTLRIGTVGPFFIMQLLKHFREEYPNIMLNLKSGNSQDVYEHILDYSLDVAVIGWSPNDRRLEKVRLGSHNIVVVVNSDHAWAGRHSIHIRELDGARIILRESGSATRLRCEEAFQALAISPRVVMELSRDALCEAVRMGFGIGLISTGEVTPRECLHAARISGYDISTQSYAICLRDRLSVRGIGLFMSVVADVYSNGESS